MSECRRLLRLYPCHGGKVLSWWAIAPTGLKMCTCKAVVSTSMKLSLRAGIYVDELPGLSPPKPDINISEMVGWQHAR